jgi:hypothetical protein
MDKNSEYLQENLNAKRQNMLDLLDEKTRAGQRVSIVDWRNSSLVRLLFSRC